MKTYIKKDHKGYYIIFPEEIDAEYWAGHIGSTLEDFYNNKWVLLSDEQVAFHEEHPYASIREVFNMQTNIVPERTLEQAKFEKKQRIEEYDNSDAVNSFTINGNQMWLTVDQRQQIGTQISANEAVGRENMTRWFNEIEFTFPISTWKQMLTALEVYAGDALNVTEAHKAAVDSLTTIEAVDSYDYTASYPSKLIF